MSEVWAFAFATLSYLAIMGLSYFYLLKMVKMESHIEKKKKFYTKLAIALVPVTGIFVIASIASFSAAINNTQRTLSQIAFAYPLLLFGPLVSSTTFLLLWRDRWKDLKERLHQ